MLNLEGKRIVLTGANGHLGKAIAKGLIDAGAWLIAIVRDEKAFRQSVSIGIEAGEVHELDLSIKKEVDALFRALEKTGIDGLVNNAFFTASGGLDESTIDLWRRGIEGTLVMPSYLMLKAIPLLTLTKGAIVNISSMYGAVAPDPDNYVDAPEFDSPPHYGAAKAGLIQVTKYAASYLGKYGIRVNSVSPGPFPSDEVQKHRAFIEKLSKQVPLGRVGDPIEMVGPVVFLLSDAASFISGHNLVVDGGWTAR